MRRDLTANYRVIGKFDGLRRVSYIFELSALSASILP